MSRITHNTDDWELHACLDWRRKWHTVKCEQCSGSGRQPRGMRDYGDDDYTCSSCLGRGTKQKESTSPKPEIPKELLEHMRRAWWDYHNKSRVEII